MLVVSGGRRQRHRDRDRDRDRQRLAAAVEEYAALGWACHPGAYAPADGDRACSCDRIGCPSPGAHPRSSAWARRASHDPAVLRRWWSERPESNIILPTGRVFDVFDVPAPAGAAALADIDADGPAAGPVAAVGDDRMNFFVATRGAPVDEDEWWSCRLDCMPENIDEMPGLRWFCRDGYVVAAPSVLPSGRTVRWLRPPQRTVVGVRLPDPVRVLEVLADACEAYAVGDGALN